MNYSERLSQSRVSRSFFFCFCFSASISQTSDQPVKQHLGMLLQLMVLAVLPLIIVFQLFYGFRLIVMPISLLTGIVIFLLGTALRESR